MDESVTKLLAEGGDAEAQYRLAGIYESMRQNISAAYWYSKAAEQEYSGALYDLQRLAQDGSHDAQYYLGFMYEYGKGGISQDDVEAGRWYRRAAEQGNDLAQYNLGDMYAQGRGVPQNDVQAYAWYNIAGAQGLLATTREARDAIANRMTREEIARAQEFARQYWEAFVVPFRN